MTLDKEKELIRDVLKSFKRMEDFEKLINSSLPYRYSKLVDCQTTKTLNAEEFRFAGNEIFRQKNHDVCVHYDILYKYNQSVAASPLNSDTLALAYSNRSAILEHIGKYKWSIASIDRAVRFTYSHALKVKLHCRKAKCLAAMGSSDASKSVQMAKFWLAKIFSEEKVHKSLTDLVNQTENHVEKGIPKPSKAEKQKAKVDKSLAKTGAKCEGIVETAHSKRHGRHLIASRDIKPGEILMMEKTINSNPTIDHTYLYCCHCNAFLWDIVPCDYCITSCFCSERCKTEAWEKYHQVECKIMINLFVIYQYLGTTCKSFTLADSSVFNLLGLRILLTALKETGSVPNLRAALQSFDRRTDQEQFMNKLPANDYRQVYALPTFVLTNTLDGIVKDSAFALVILAKIAPIFEKIIDSSNLSIEELMGNDDVMFIGALLLKFCSVVGSHCFQIRRAPVCKREAPCESIGCGLLSSVLGVKTSLTLNSCIPNATRCIIESNQIILYSILPIKKGEQICTSFLGIFDDAPKDLRQRCFYDHYGFSCKCQACKEDWPFINYKTEAFESYEGLSSTLSGRKLTIYNEFRELFESVCFKDSDLTHAEVMAKFSKLIQDSLKEAPLPSKPTRFIIRGFINAMQLIQGYPNKLETPDDCYK